MSLSLGTGFHGIPYFFRFRFRRSIWACSEQLLLVKYEQSIITEYPQAEIVFHTSNDRAGTDMTIAELHGKIKPFETLEDLLTSDVFGAFRYCDPNHGLLPFLQEAVCFSDLQTRPGFLDGWSSAEYFFWPRSKGFEREPDLIVILERSDGSSLAIDIEAKYKSGKHNKHEDVYEINHLSGDQLHDQYRLMRNKQYTGRLAQKLEHAAGFYVFYVTAHYVPPVNDIKETMEKVKGAGDEESIENFFWLNWSAACKTCSNFKSDEDIRTCLIFQDLRALLLRKSLAGLSLWELDVNTNENSHWFWSDRLWRALPHSSVHLKDSFFWREKG